MRDYFKLVKENHESLGRMHPVAIHLAEFLHHPLLSIENGGYLEVRKQIHDKLSGIMIGAGLDQLEPEREYYENLVKNSRDRDKPAPISPQIKRILKGIRSSEAQLARAIAVILDKVPKLQGKEDDYFCEVKRKELLAELNLILLDLGLDSLMPEIKTVHDSQALHLDPAKDIKVMVVDDEAKCLFETVLPLAGMPRISFEFVHVQVERRSERDKNMEELASVIMEADPDIIFMDQGLCAGFEGNQLIEGLGAKGLNCIYIANTGGSKAALNRAGALGHAEKGRESIYEMRQALRYL